VEVERGITVKAHTTSMFYKYKGEHYLLNLIDTPVKKVSQKKLLQKNSFFQKGHVDFSYEVSRALSASQGLFILFFLGISAAELKETLMVFFFGFLLKGALLVVDASKGVQAQTVANFYLAMENGLDIIPVINKIDLPSATVENAIQQMSTTFEFKQDEMLFVNKEKNSHFPLFF
jgi:translation elongation factor EF-4